MSAVPSPAPRDGKPARPPITWSLREATAADMDGILACKGT